MTTKDGMNAGDEATAPPVRPASSAEGLAFPASETDRYKWVALALLVGAYVFNFIDRSILSILQEPIKRDLGLADWQLGLMGGFAFAVFYATLGIPIARLADRTSRSKVIAASIFVWSLMTALCGAARNFGTLLLFRIGVGVGEAGCSPPAHSLISDYFPPHRRATALGLYSMGIQLGVMFGFLAGGWINQFFGWRQAFLVVGLPGLLYAGVVAIALREPPRGLSEGRQAEAAVAMPSMLSVFRLLWSRHSFRHLALAAALHAFVGYGVGGWLPPFFMRSFGMKTGEVGTWVALLAGPIGGTGVLVGGWLADRLGTRDARWYPWVCALSVVVALPFGVTALLSGSFYVAFVFYLVPAFVGPFFNAPSYAMTQGLVPLRMRAAAAAILLFVINIIGMGLGPTITGAVSDALAPRFGAESLRYALVIMVFVRLWSAVHYVLAARTLREDLALAQGNTTQLAT